MSKDNHKAVEVHNLEKRFGSFTADLSFQDLPGTDYHAVSRGHVSITPLHIDLTNYASIDTLKGWEVR